MRRHCNRLAAEARAEGMAEGIAEGRAEGIVEGRLSTLSELVSDGIFTLEEAARRMGMNVQAFQEAVKAL